MRHFPLRLLALPFLLLLLANCGGSNDSPSAASESPAAKSTSSAVAYDGTTLIVDNIRYERSADVKLCPTITNAVCSSSGGYYMQGNVLIEFNNTAGRESQVETEITRLGLTVKQKSSSTFSAWTIEVPALFEEQWVSALRRNSLYDGGVFVNRLYAPD